MFPSKKHTGIIYRIRNRLRSLTQFQFSESTKEQIEDLVYRAKNGELTQEDKTGLDEL